MDIPEEVTVKMVSVTGQGSRKLKVDAGFRKVLLQGVSAPWRGKYHFDVVCFVMPCIATSVATVLFVTCFLLIYEMH
jgi:hypothetical protein